MKKNKKIDKTQQERNGYTWLKYTVVLVFICGLNLHAAGFSQNVKVNLQFQNADIRTVMKEIKRQTQYDFVYNSSQVDLYKKISLNLKDASLETALKACFEDSGLSYVIDNNIIVLKKAALNQPQEKYLTLKGKVLDSRKQPLPGVSVYMLGTNWGVSTDVNGAFSFQVPDEPDIELVFSFVGMETVHYTVKDSKNIQIIMKSSDETLEEVVVTGMETVKKERMTGSATVLTAKDLKMRGITSIDRILDGMVAGLNSTAVSGAPGMRSKITIRGENNLNGNTEPLWIVDGLPMLSGVPKNNTGDYAGTIMQDGVGNIMPEDIESISILKDASAAAIYGARAANGVIVITTKKGFRSKTQITYNGTYNCGIAPRNRLDFMNSAEKIKYEQSIIRNFGLSYADWTGRGGYLYKRMAEGYLTPGEYQQQLNKLVKTNTNWFDVLFRTAQSQSHSISLRGGSDELTYYTSVNFQQQNGILRSNQYQNAGVLVKLDYRPVKNLILALNVSANTRKNNDHASAIDPFQYAVFANPYEKPWNEDGSYASDLSFLSGNYTGQKASGYKYDDFNIVKELKETRNTQTGLDAELTFNLRYEILQGLAVESIIRKSVSYNTEMTEVNAGTYTSWIKENFARKAYPDTDLIPIQYDNGQLSESSGRNHSWSIRNQIDYSFDIQGDHLFTLMLANEIVSKKFNNFGYTSPVYYQDYRITGIPAFGKEVPYNSLFNEIQGMFNTKDGQDRSVSFVGNLRYGYKDRYIANFTYRADGADVIGDKNRYTPLWSVGLRYNLHNENFFKNSVINELAIRGSYGYTGSIDRTAYPFSKISLGSDMYMGNRYVDKLVFPNPTVSWEKKRDRNLGLEMGLFDNRVNFTLEYYSNKTTDVLENLDVPNSTGRTNVMANGGVVENSGLEFYLNVRWVNHNDFAFSTSCNIARNKNVIKKAKYNFGTYKKDISSKVTQGGIVNIIGEETGSIYGWKTAGVNPVTGNPRYYLTEEGKRDFAKFLDGWNTYDKATQERYMQMLPSLNEIPEAVDFVRDQDMRDSFFDSSMQYLGRSNPKFVGGFNTQMRYKSFEFTTSWTFKTGHLIPNFNDYGNAPNNWGNAGQASIGYASDLSVSATNREKKYLYYWQAPGDVTDVAKFVTGGNDYWAPLYTSEKYSSGNYLRLTNVSLSYRFPQRILSRLRMNNLALGFNANNLLTFTKYRGLDVGSGGAFAYPVSREFNFKLTVGF